MDKSIKKGGCRLRLGPRTIEYSQFQTKSTIIKKMSKYDKEYIEYMEKQTAKIKEQTDILNKLIYDRNKKMSEYLINKQKESQQQDKRKRTSSKSKKSSSNSKNKKIKLNFLLN